MSTIEMLFFYSKYTRDAPDPSIYSHVMPVSVYQCSSIIHHVAGRGDHTLVQVSDLDLSGSGAR